MIVEDLAPTGALRTSINLGNPVLAQGVPAALDTFRRLGLEVAAGIRQPMTTFVDRDPGFRLLTGRFMEIRQALGTTKNRRPETLRFLRDFIEELKASGFVADSLRRANHADVAVAGPAEPGPTRS